jgi:ligand-binding sensor domain-containing protein/tRNA A-37 threonylcarbamoyl transferase component Bud32
MLGPYQITSQIGKGGMATVYKAYQAAMDRYVALKVVAGQFADDKTFMQRFRQEARMIAKLEHPHILPVHDFGEADGIPYMVMRFLEAGTLNERLDAGQLSLPEIDRIFSQLTEALEYAHENGVIHRDIKPSNAMLDRRGDVFLTDFGIAKMLEGTSALTATGAITGTPAYMSPEQAQGQKVDQRSDIYSLGIVLFEMLTGRVPFEAETPMAVLFRQIQDPPPPLSLVRPDLPYTLEAVLLKALAKNPTERYASMHDFRAGWKNALKEAANASPVVATPPPTIPVSARDEPPILPTMEALASTKPMPAAAPVKKGFKWKTLLAIGIPIFMVILCLSLVYVFRRQIFTRFAQGQATGRPTELAQAATATTSVPSGETSAPPAGKHISWAGANSVFSIGFRGDEVLTSGFGGVTIWNRNDHSYLQITTADGLPSANAGAIFVDNDKSLWVGTDAGLVHIQGNEHTVYTGDQGLVGTVVVITRSGDRLLAGTWYSGGAGSGLFEFDGKAWKPVPGFPSDPNPSADDETVSYNVRKIVTDTNGYLWVPTEVGIAMLDGDKDWNIFKTEKGMPDNNVHTVYVDREGGVWAGTAGGGVAKFNNEKWAFENFADLKDSGIYDVTSILEDQDGNLWFMGGNAVRYNPKTKESKPFNADQGDVPFYINATGADEQGALYFGNDGSGLARYKDDKFELFLVPNAPRYGQYGRILPAPGGKLIFAQLYGNGADEYDPAAKSWSKIPPDQNLPLAFDAQGQMWSSNNGLWIFGPDKNTHLTTELGLPSNQVNAIAFGANGLAYIATDAGIAVFDGLKVTDIYNAAKNGLVSDQVYTLFLASDGSLWAGLDGGFSRRLPDGTWQNFTAEKLFGGSSQYFPAFVENQAGDIGVATLGDGLYLFSKDKWKRLHATDPGVGLPSDYLISATVAPDGSIWFGTDGQGAVRYDGKNWQRYGMKDGLLSETVNGIYVEPGGAVWFTTNGGVTRLEP